MEPVSLFVVSVLVGLLLSWLLLRPSRVDDHSDIATADEEFFQRIQKQLDQSAPAGTEGGYHWTQTSEEVELVIPLDAHTRAKDVDCRITPVSMSLNVRGAPAPLLKVPLLFSPTEVAYITVRCAS